MVNALYLIFIIILLYIHLLPISLLLKPNTKSDTAINFAFSSLIILLLSYCLEHFIHLKFISLFLPFTTIFSLILILKNRIQLFNKENNHLYIAFSIGFFYVFLWRFLFPEINSNSEEMTDLYILSHYFKDSTLPHLDTLLSGDLFNSYYDFQFYGSAFFFRILKTDLIISYQLSLCLLYGFLTALIFNLGSYFDNVRTRTKYLSILIILFSSNGVTALAPFILKDGTDLIWSSVRFIGENSDQLIPSIISLVKDYDIGNTIHLPMEFPAYLIYLGSLHPPITGFIILMLSLNLYCSLIKRYDSREEFLFYLTPLFAYLSNAWVLPMQGFFVLFYIIRKNRLLNFNNILASFSVTLFVLVIKLSHMRNIPSEYGFDFISSDLRAPTLLSLIVFYPLIIIFLCNLFQKNIFKKYKEVFIMIVFGFIFSSLIFFRELYGGLDVRFTTINKWWPWLHLFSFSFFFYSSFQLKRKLWKFVSLLFIFSTMSYGAHLVKYIYETPKPYMGDLYAQSHIYKPSTMKHITSLLESTQKGTILHPIDGGVYTYDPLFPTLTKHNSLLAWPFLMREYKGKSSLIDKRENFINSFYNNEIEDPIPYLLSKDVQVIFWKYFKDLGYDEQANPNLKQELEDRQHQVNYKIKSHFTWIRIDETIGLWLKQKNYE